MSSHSDSKSLSAEEIFVRIEQSFILTVVDNLTEPITYLLFWPQLLYSRANVCV